MQPRDALSERYDRSARRVMSAAVEVHRLMPAKPRSAVIFVSSPPRSFEDLDRGGRTRNERAFTRSVYWLAKNDNPRKWSPKLTWGPIARKGTRWGRYVRVRLFRYRAGLAHARSRPDTSYIERPELGTKPGDRM